MKNVVLICHLTIAFWRIEQCYLLSLIENNVLAPSAWRAENIGILHLLVNESHVAADQN
jgi:hypothetical protein